MFALGQKQTCAAHKPNIFDLTQGRNDEIVTSFSLPSAKWEGRLQVMAHTRVVPGKVFGVGPQDFVRGR
jgi:hypothetical protein